MGTLIACNELATRDRLLELLKMTENYRLNGNSLHLTRARMASLAWFEARSKQTYQPPWLP
jgi:hypothetical protein